jgi:hypothetical protein
VPDAKAGCRWCRLRLVDLLVKMWLWKGRLCFTRPLAVALKRLAARDGF